MGLFVGSLGSENGNLRVGECLSANSRGGLVGVLCFVVNVSRFLVGVVGVYNRADSGRGPGGGVARGVRECRVRARRLRTPRPLSVVVLARRWLGC